MGISQVQRVIKRGNVRTFDEEYNRGFTDIWASELDADLDLLYDMWNASFGGLGDAIITPTPPLNPNLGDLWWRPTDGNLFVYYDDGNSKQFVPAVSTALFVGTGLPNGPAGGDLAGSYPSPVIAPKAVTTDKIFDLAVTDAQILNVAWGKVTGAPTRFPPTGPAGGTGPLTGSYPDPSVTYSKITGIPTSLPPSGPAGAGGGALTGTYPNPGVNYNLLTNKPTIPVIPAALPPNGAAGGDLTGNYPGPQLRIGSTVKLAQPSALGGPIGLSLTEELVIQSSWTAIGGKWFAMANVHGHIGIPGTGPSNGISSRLLLDGTSNYVGDGYPLSSQAISSLGVASGGAVVPFTIHHVTGGVAAAGLHFLKLTAFITGALSGANGVDSASMMIFETT